MLKPGTKFYYRPINWLNGKPKMNHKDWGRVGQIIKVKEITNQLEPLYYFRFLGEFTMCYADISEIEVIE